jgi:hypothetical protein
MPKGLGSSMSEHLGMDTRAMWRTVTEHLETACGWRSIPQKPTEISHLTPLAIAELRASDDVTRSHILRAYNDSAVARSSAIADNISRLRGLLCCLRYWRKVQRANPDDMEAAQGVLTTWHFARDRWGIQNPPDDSRQWDSYSEAHVLAMADRMERGQRRS